jgi:hypothetical protein
LGGVFHEIGWFGGRAGAMILRDLATGTHPGMMAHMPTRPAMAYDFGIYGFGTQLRNTGD